MILLPISIQSWLPGHCAEATTNQKLMSFWCKSCLSISSKKPKLNKVQKNHRKWRKRRK